MGYYTNYRLEVPENNFALIAEFISSNESAQFALDDNGNSYQETKWYDWDKDIKDFSLKYPNVMFEMFGEGESNRDIWKAYIKNGQMQLCRAELIYPEFDESKMTD